MYLLPRHSKIKIIKKNPTKISSRCQNDGNDYQKNQTSSTKQITVKKKKKNEEIKPSF